MKSIEFEVKTTHKIICGETRCYSERNKPCPQLRFGFDGYCSLFDKLLIEDDAMWLLRCDECLEAEPTKNKGY